MPINEQVIDTLAHLLAHYQQDHPAETDVSAGDLAVYVEAHACDGCGVARGAPGRGGGRDEGQLPEIFTE
jgi:hypothetical protein